MLLHDEAGGQRDVAARLERMRGHHHYVSDLKEVDCETLWIVARDYDCGIRAAGLCRAGNSPGRHELRR
jgi:hypothetical protein